MSLAALALVLSEADTDAPTTDNLTDDSLEPGDIRGPGKIPHPTHHREGTPGKVRVMRQRYLRGEQLFHPLDGLVEAPSKPPRKKRLSDAWSDERRAAERVRKNEQRARYRAAEAERHAAEVARDQPRARRFRRANTPNSLWWQRVQDPQS